MKLGYFRYAIVSLFRLLSIMLVWQGMNELYKFDESDTTQVIYLLFLSFYILVVSEFLNDKVK